MSKRKKLSETAQETAQQTQEATDGFFEQMRKNQEAADAERARQVALQERMMRAQEIQSEGLHALAAALRDVGFALVGVLGKPVGAGWAPGKKVADAKPSDTKAEPVSKDAPTPKTEPAPEPKAKAPQFADVRKAIVALASMKSSDAAFAVLKTFGVEAISDLKPEQYADVIRAADAAREAK